MDPAEQREEGWRQVEAGLALIQWSKLAQWDAHQFAFIATDVATFESEEGHGAVHRTFGRLVCWIAFSTGAEYLVRGAWLLKDQVLSKPIDVFRIPSGDEDLDKWAGDVIKGKVCVKETINELGSLGKVPWKTVLQGVAKPKRVQAAYELLRDTIRNRDAHRYSKDVRAFHFHVVGMLFVPAFNAVLRSLNQAELRARVFTLGRTSS